jgi:hypothetical protein
MHPVLASCSLLITGEKVIIFWISWLKRHKPVIAMLLGQGGEQCLLLT